ncbi:MAG: DUF4340 domain-containing protein [Pirellulaceae bacterium]
MNETIRTLIYVGSAAVVGLLAYASRPATVTKTPRDALIGQPLFASFTDPLAARSLEIVEFDESTAELRPFEVAQRNGLWVIPSEGNYPADAEKQIQQAAGSLLGLEIVDVVAGETKEHALYGVLEPDRAKLKVGDKDVGTLVSLQDAQGDDLVRLIVGKVVEGRPELRFVRKPAEELVYVAKISLDSLPTDFDKWIEKDLLKLNTFDISRLTLKDYSVVPTQRGPFSFSGRMEAAVAWNAEQSNWLLDSLKMYAPASNRWVDAGLGPQEELNRQKLDDLKTALDDLKIVDVSRKPERLVSSLKSGADISQDQELVAALMGFGFLPATMPGSDEMSIVASNGEVVVDMKDGVQYVLRFGNVSGAQRTSSADKPADGAPADALDEVKLNRYLFVTAQLSPHTLAAPMLEPEPAGPEAPPADAPAAEEDKPAETDADKPADEEKLAEEAKPGEETKPADPMAAERDRIKRDNERKLNEYRDKKKQAEARVAEMNARFADWYYVISEDVYQKLHLSRADIVKEGATARDEGFNVDAFRKLESEGVNPPPPAPAAPSNSGLPPGFPPGFPPGM